MDVKRQCPSCGRLVALTVRGTFRNHKNKGGRIGCDMGETPSDGAKAPDRPQESGLYWVRFAYRASWQTEWSVSAWDGERWTNIGHDDSFEPSESSIVEWRGPLKPPTR